MIRLLLSLSFVSSLAFADRSVSISVPDGKLQLTNGSSVTVTYTVECYDKSTGSNIISNGSSVTLAAKAAVTYTSTGTCASGGVPIKTLSQGPFYCAGSVTFANANNLCGTDSQICTFQKLNQLSVHNLSHSGYEYYWIKPSTASAWSQTYNSGNDWSARDTTSDAPITSKTSSYLCDSSATGTATGTYTVSYCSSTKAANTSSGTLCCPTNNGFASCKVTILSATPAGGHLQSPQFKGGASF